MARDIVVKVLGRISPPDFQFLDLPRKHRNIAFAFDRDLRDYDWLLVYDDLPRTGSERLPISEERLGCARERTILLTYEPSSIKYYGADYVNQFGTVMTSHDAVSLQHPNRIEMPPVGVWLYGGMGHVTAHPRPPHKVKEMSVFASAKRMRHSLHAVRHGFLAALQQEFEGEIDVYGRGHRYVEHKAEALDRYRYHVAVENHIEPHHWTEKLSDCFLGYCLPFYAGCPNADDYFPAESFIRIDMRDGSGAASIIRQAIRAGEFEKRLPAIVEARRRVIEEYNLGNCISKFVAGHHERTASARIDGSVILSRHKLMRRDLSAFLRYAAGKVRMRQRYRRHWRAYIRRNRTGHEGD